MEGCARRPKARKSLDRQRVKNPKTRLTKPVSTPAAVPDVGKRKARGKRGCARSKQARGLRQAVFPGDKCLGCCELAGRLDEGVKGGEEGGQTASKLTSLWRSRDSGSHTRLTGLNPFKP